MRERERESERAGGTRSIHTGKKGLLGCDEERKRERSCTIALERVYVWLKGSLQLYAPRGCEVYIMMRDAEREQPRSVVITRGGKLVVCIYTLGVGAYTGCRLLYASQRLSRVCSSLHEEIQL